MKTPALSKQGFALLTVLLSITLLVNLYSTYIVATSQSALNSKHFAGRIRAELTNDSALNIAVSYLIARIVLVDKSKVPINGEPITCSIDDTRMLRFSMRDVAGLVDLNTGDMTLIRSVLEFVFKSPTDVSKFTAKIRNTRNAEDRFESIPEFSNVVASNDKIQEKLTRYFTIHSGRTGVSQNAMSPSLKEYLKIRIEPQFITQPLSDGVYQIEARTPISKAILLVSHYTVRLKLREKTGFSILDHFDETRKNDLNQVSSSTALPERC